MKKLIGSLRPQGHRRAIQLDPIEAWHFQERQGSLGRHVAETD
jgi:hypothetical protein